MHTFVLGSGLMLFLLSLGAPLPPAVANGDFVPMIPAYRAIAGDTTGRESIQALYDAQDAAYGQKDLIGAFAGYSPDFVRVSETGHSGADKPRHLAWFLMCSCKSVRRASTVTDIESDGPGTVTVTVQRRVDAVCANPQTGQDDTVVISDTDRDFWARIGGTWRLQRQRALSSVTTVDDVPIIEPLDCREAPSSPADAALWPIVPTYALYPVVNDPDVQAFVQHSLAYASLLFGPPVGPVRRVQIRLTCLPLPNPGLRHGFSECSPVDIKKGDFIIYSEIPPSDPRFYGILGHEVCHLLNHDILDGYMEGLCTVFAEEALKREHRDPTWPRREEQKNRDPFYTASFFMMREVYDAVGSDGMQTFLHYAVQNDGPGAPADAPMHIDIDAPMHIDIDAPMHIDIDRWLASLTPGQSARARAIINRYTKTILDGLHSPSPGGPEGRPGYTFVPPQ